MKATRIVYKRNFVIAQYVTESVELEVQLDNGDTERQAIRYAKATIEDWHKESNPNIQTDYFKGPEETQVSRTPKEKEILKEIKEISEVEPDQKRFTDWIKKTYPDYIDHITVKTLIKLKSKK